jgi:hypothetical protein
LWERKKERGKQNSSPLGERIEVRGNHPAFIRHSSWFDKLTTSQSSVIRFYSFIIAFSSA